MGCDIHAIVERRQSYRDRTGEEYRHEWLSSGDPDIGRNYEIFAALAGVRNSVGLEPAAEPRGLPSFKGVHPEYGWLQWHNSDEKPSRLFERHYEDYGQDAHSASWLTLAELKAYDATQEVDDPALIVGRDDEGKVTATAAWTSGPSEGPVGLRRVFVWPGRDGEPTSWDRLVQYLEGVRAQHDLTDDEVRLVFFFDN